MAQWVRRELEAWFTDVHRRALDVLAEVRSEAQEVMGTSELAGWDDAIDDRFFSLVATGDISAARRRARHAVGLGTGPDLEVGS